MYFFQIDASYLTKPRFFLNILNEGLFILPSVKKNYIYIFLRGGVEMDNINNYSSFICN